MGAFEENADLNYLFDIRPDQNAKNVILNSLTSQGEVVTVITYPYLSAGAPAQGKAKGLIKFLDN